MLVNVVVHIILNNITYEHYLEGFVILVHLYIDVDLGGQGYILFPIDDYVRVHVKINSLLPTLVRCYDLSALPYDLDH